MPVRAAQLWLSRADRWGPEDQAPPRAPTPALSPLMWVPHVRNHSVDLLPSARNNRAAIAARPVNSPAWPTHFTTRTASAWRLQLSSMWAPFEQRCPYPRYQSPFSPCASRPGLLAWTLWSPRRLDRGVG
jgi:hypothetical protein